MVILVPCMKATGESNYTIPMFPPYSVNITCNGYQRSHTLIDKTVHKIGLPKTKHDLIMSQVSIVVNRKDGFCLNCIEWKESIIQTVSCSFYNLFRHIQKIFLCDFQRNTFYRIIKITFIYYIYWNADVRPFEIFRG